MTEQQAEATQADAQAESQADIASGTDQQHGNGQAPAPNSVDALPDWAQKQIREARKDAAKYRTRVQEFEDAQKTEAERAADALKAAEERAQQYEQRYQSAIAQSAVTDAASKAGAISARAVYMLIRDDITFDDAGDPSNIAELIGKARSDEPQLFRASGGSGDGGKGTNNGPPSTTDMNAVIRGLARTQQ
jgi:hypothetical protein